jgi:hypothetical protein
MSIWSNITGYIYGLLGRHESPPAYSPLPNDSTILPCYDKSGRPSAQGACLTLNTSTTFPCRDEPRRPSSRGLWLTNILSPGRRKKQDEPVDWSRCNFGMSFAEDTHYPGHGWYGSLSLQAKDIPRLMREGLYWTEANLDYPAGHIKYDYLESWNRYYPSGWYYQRVLFFQDTAIDPQWKAKMIVFCRDMHGLSRFRFRELRLDQITFCRASHNGALVYSFDRTRKTVNCINTMYEDMPLDGWWPWPKKATSEESTVQGSQCHRKS